MNERERMLAEGPRVAPEPRVIGGLEPTDLASEPRVIDGFERPDAAPEPQADGGFASTEPTPSGPSRPAPNTLTLPNTLRMPGRGSRAARPWYVRFLPVAAIALFALARNASTGDWPAVVIAVLPLLVAAFVIVRLALKRLKGNS